MRLRFDAVKLDGPAVSGRPSLLSQLSAPHVTLLFFRFARWM